MIRPVIKNNDKKWRTFPSWVNEWPISKTTLVLSLKPYFLYTIGEVWQLRRSVYENNRVVEKNQESSG